MTDENYWVVTASADHAARGQAEGIVQANHGIRRQLTIAGVPVGRIRVGGGSLFTAAPGKGISAHREPTGALHAYITLHRPLAWFTDVDSTITVSSSTSSSLGSDDTSTVADRSPAGTTILNCRFSPSAESSVTCIFSLPLPSGAGGGT